jgi:hypothetical protein
MSGTTARQVLVSGKEKEGEDVQMRKGITYPNLIISIHLHRHKGTTTTLLPLCIRIHTKCSNNIPNKQLQPRCFVGLLWTRAWTWGVVVAPSGNGLGFDFDFVYPLTVSLLFPVPRASIRLFRLVLRLPTVIVKQYKVDKEGEDVYTHVGGDPFLDVRDDVLGMGLVLRYSERGREERHTFHMYY